MGLGASGSGRAESSDVRQSSTEDGANQGEPRCRQTHVISDHNEFDITTSLVLLVLRGQGSGVGLLRPFRLVAARLPTGFQEALVNTSEEGVCGGIRGDENKSKRAEVFPLLTSKIL